MIAVAGEAFGFGPASKCVAIMRAIGPDRCIALGTATSREFFNANDLRCAPLQEYPSHAELAHLVEVNGIDAAIVALDADLAETFLDLQIPVTFIDSLGFMWDSSHVQNHSRLYEQAAYVCQDVLGAKGCLEAAGATSLTAVGAIVDCTTDSGIAPCDIVLALGGMYAHGNDLAVATYLDFIGRIATRLSPTDSEILVLSSRGASAYLKARFPHLRCESLSHAQALGHMANARRVLTAPGLTTLLELSALGVSVHPLPPQNYSQCRIVQQCVELGIARTAPWTMYHSRFPVGRGLPEQEGIKVARAFMSELAGDDLSEGVLAEMLSEPAAALRLTDDFDGVRAVADLFATSL